MAGGQPTISLECSMFTWHPFHAHYHLNVNSMSSGTSCIFCSWMYHKHLENTWHIVNIQDMFAKLVKY